MGEEHVVGDALVLDLFGEVPQDQRGRLLVSSGEVFAEPSFCPSADAKATTSNAAAKATPKAVERLPSWRKIQRPAGRARVRFAIGKRALG